MSAIDIADALGRPHPTPEQRAVIESPLGPALVVAGAGSGKTETMANRVLWLLANRRLAAHEVLGLTFTRKAAGELATRVRERIDELAARGLVPDHDAFAPPTVATYNSFANTIYRDNAALLGRESDGAVLGAASAWQLARSLVVASTDPRLPSLGKSVDSVTKAVLQLAGALNENIADPDAVADLGERFTAVAELPRGGTGAYPDVDTWATTVGALPVLIDLARAFDAEKVRRGFVEYSDQVALALRIAERFPRVGAELAGRFRVVLLDEYQDTSVVQTRLLARLFGGGAVMAVGDPHQSIYGWRGASAANLDEFPASFGDGAEAVHRFSLATSWRNGHDILAAANTLVAPLTARTRVRVEALRAGPAASSIPIAVAVEQTLLDEADAVARWFAERLETATPPTAAMLFRTRKTIDWFIDALRRHGVPFHVLGVGGLVHEPEIADLVCALTVLHDPSAGSQLVRLLAGSRWRIGARDLQELAHLARWLSDRDYAQRPLDDEVRERIRSSLVDTERGSIVDALDFLSRAAPDHGALRAFSPEGLERLREAGGLFVRLRSRTGLDLVDLVTVVQQELLLDIEVAANDARPLGRENFDAFFDAVGSYLQVDDRASLGGFLGWLREAEWRDDLSPRPEEPEPGTVQLLTIHGAKGLEWDLVAVPRLVEDELPGRPNEGFTGWLSFGTLPYPFRGDAAELPELAWEEATTRKEVVQAVDAFKARVRERVLLEERRLAYVALTRARHELLLSASFWATQSAWRAPSRFLVELEAAGRIGVLPTAPDSDEKPDAERLSTFSWPLDPLGGRRAAVEAAAELVRTARTRDPQTVDAGEWQHELDLLLAERAARLRADELVPLPTRVPASRFKDFVTDPATVAASLRRPMPQRPYRATRLGTLFHSWVEGRYGLASAGEQVDSLPTELDLGGDLVDDEATLRSLQATFERSEWATRRPIEVEREVHLVLDDRVVVCKIDAVYESAEGVQIVDWKTGRAPTGADDLAGKRLQLALYRLAYSAWAGVPPESVDAVFYYVADDLVVRPERLESREELLARWRAALD